ncbi:MAG TPA: AAA family ATPase [Chthoniobacterales bacterium]|nr:AAA family ATPase [Chthoniobacterales bacterium]
MKSTAAQDELLTFLRSPASYSEKPEAVEIRQTHISIVAMTPSFVFKIKKPLDLGFLDFSTLEKRREACEAEVRLNQRLCRDVYLGVVPISRKDGALHFGEEGEAIDYAVKMRRLPEEGFLEQRLTRNGVTSADLDRVADKLSGFYRSQQSSTEIAEWGRGAKLRISTDENFSQTEPFVGTLLSRAAFEAIRYFADLFYDRHADLFDRRRKDGRILDCHGDLRCAHIHFSQGEINIFDCIEFNERLRYLDVANDVAFLAMDLDFRGRPDLATAFTRRMAATLDDAGLLEVIDFYKCYRAYVRGKIFSIKSSEPEVPAAERETSREKAGRFFRLALSYAIAGSEPMVLAVTGRVGVGKSSVARMIGQALGAEVFSSDRTRKELAGIKPHVRVHAAARAELYREAMTGRTYEAVIIRAIEAARVHGSAIIDATFGQPKQRALLRERLAAAGIQERFLVLDASDNEITERLRHREQSKTEVSDARLEDFEMLSAAYDRPDGGEHETRAIIASSSSVEATATETLKALIRLNLCD